MRKWYCVACQGVLKKKSVAVGWILLILGLIGLILALILYPSFMDSGGAPDEYKIVALVLGGLLVGTPMLLGGAYLVAARSSYNRKIDGALIQKATQPSQMYQPAPGSRGYCSHCGYQLVSGTEFCPKCGKKQG